jgi:hypothetical protein
MPRFSVQIVAFCQATDRSLRPRLFQGGKNMSAKPDTVDIASQTRLEHLVSSFSARATFPIAIL